VCALRTLHLLWRGGHCPPRWFWGLAFEFPSPVRRLDISQTGGGLGEHCSSSAVGHVLCAPLGRVAQPRLFAKCRGNPEGGGKPGATSFGYFSWQDKKSD
jgi:hypothetical protein